MENKSIYKLQIIKESDVGSHRFLGIIDQLK